MINEHDLSSLFDKQYPTIRFSEDPKDHLPLRGSIIYTVFDRREKFIYVGIAGIQKLPDRRSSISRMMSHRSGRRSGDQFCVYVHDAFVIPELVKKGSYAPSRGLLDRLTKEYIQENLSYRFCSFKTDDSIGIVRSLEKQIKNGCCGLKPYLNGLD